MALLRAPPNVLRLRRSIWAAGSVLAVLTLLAGSTAASPATGASHLSPHGLPKARGLSWRHLSPVQSPAKRNWFGMAYDYVAHYTVLYGGYDPTSAGFYNDTWAYVAGNWTNLNLSVHPSADSGLKMVYDPALGGVVAFGGEAPYGSAYFKDTWLFAGGVWTQLFPTVSPPARSQFAMAYDAADSEIVLFGGYAGGASFSDTWTFNGTTWTPVTTALHPQPRVFANMVYDSKSGETLLAGGVATATSGPLNATWEFRGGAWKRLSHSDFPGRVHTPLAALGNGTPFFFGGQSSSSGRVFNTSFEFFGGAWHPVKVAHAPSPRSNGGLVYDAADGHLVMFGGGIYPTIFNGTYLLR